MAYAPIENYGVIGNMRTAALVGKHGSIDWYCVPHFDSPSVFAAILDDERGGRFEIAPVGNGAATKQLYWPETNVLITRFLSPDGVGEIEDFMPVGGGDTNDWRDHLIRRVRVVRGCLKFLVRCHPAFDYARAKHETVIDPGNGADFHSPGLSLRLATEVPLRPDGRGVSAEFTLREGEKAIFVIRPIEKGSTHGAPPSPGQTEELFKATVDFWRHWISASTYHGRWREMVHRSALVLKLLTFEPTGAIVAAPTCSLPEHIGGVRNWDYRYTWMRDAAFTIYALLRIGFTEEAAQFMSWLDARCAEATRNEGAADRLRHRRPQRSDRDDARSSRGLPRLPSGAHRQRRRRPAPARHLRRADGLGLPLQQARARRSPTTSGATCGSCWTGCARTGSGRTRGSGRCAAAGSISSTRS